MSRFNNLQIQDIKNLASEMQGLKEYGMLSSKSGNGQLLGFIKGLRISAKLIYSLREILNGKGYSVGWGHVIDLSSGKCSPECDVIIYKGGHYSKWNENKNPIMEFVFVEAKNVKGVISCKSILKTIETDYTEKIKAMGIPYIGLFAEACSHTNYENLKDQASEEGYSGLWCSYFICSGDEYLTDDAHLIDFSDEMKRVFP